MAASVLQRLAVHVRGLRRAPSQRVPQSMHADVGRSGREAERWCAYGKVGPGSVGEMSRQSLSAVAVDSSPTYVASFSSSRLVGLLSINSLLETICDCS
jgi:hypothetical protein